MMCSDWFLLSWKSVIFSFAMALKSIFTTPEKLAWKISVCPASGLMSLMTWTGVVPELESIRLRDNKRTVHDYLPARPQTVDPVLGAIQSQ